MSKNDDHYEGALLEDMNDKYTKLLEIIGMLGSLPAQVAEINRRTKKMEQDIQVIKHVVTSHSDQLHDHEKRITALETV